MQADAALGLGLGLGPGLGPGLGLGLAAVVANGLMVRATLDQSLKQLPARHRIGPVAHGAYARAADLTGRGSAGIRSWQLPWW
jgi:hypothetical protein